MNDTTRLTLTLADWKRMMFVAAVGFGAAGFALGFGTCMLIYNLPR